jgi:hypothetical protein
MRVRKVASSTGAGFEPVLSTPMPITDFPFIQGEKTQITVCTERYGFYAWKR